MVQSGISDPDLTSCVREALAARDKRWRELDAAGSLEVLAEVHARLPEGLEKEQLAGYINHCRRRRRADIVVDEVRGESLQKAGRDIAIFGAMAGVYAYFGHPEVSEWQLSTLLLCAPLGCVFYLWALLKGNAMVSDARRRTAEVGPDI